MSGTTTEAPTLAEHEKASLEIAFLLDIFASTIHELMGGATASVSRIAGRSMGRKLPVTLFNPDIQQVLQAVATQFKGGFDLSCACEKQLANLTVGKCAIRDMCRSRNMELNGALCQLFHYYLDGVVNELYMRPVKSRIASTGEKCEVLMDVK
jgi:hypothetical protein